MAAKRVLLVVNRKSARGASELDAALSQLTEAGYALKSHYVDKPASIPEVIDREAAGCDLVVVGGGDGTVNAAAEALIRCRLPMGLLPLGTANDLARTLDIPLDPAEAVRVMLDGERHPIDIGQVNGRHFLNVATLGLGARITRYHDGARKRRLKIFSYVPSVIEAYRTMRPFSARISCDGEAKTVRAVQVSVGNGRFHGGGIAVSKDAAIDDHTLDVYYLKPLGLKDLPVLFITMRFGRHGSLPVAEALRGREIEVHTRRPMPINTDGEITTQTPAMFKVLPDALTVIVPRSYLTDRFGADHAA